MKALIELLDRDGQVRQAHAVQDWPLALGRALDNDVVLSDPHVAAHHLRIEQGEAGLELVALASLNGVPFGRRRLRAGERATIDPAAAPVEIGAGRTRLQLRLAGQPLAPERPLAAARGPSRTTVWVGAALLLLALLFETWLVNDPTELPAAFAGLVLGAAVGVGVWCGAWALLTKTFTRRTRFAWHLKVVLFAALAWLAADTLPSLVGFAFSWPAVSDFGFLLSDAIGAAALYYHLLALEPTRLRLMRAVAVVAWLSAVGLGLWFNQQREQRYGEELYLSHLFPPALRLARPVSAETFVGGLTPLQATLERRAKEPPRGEEDRDDGN